MTSAETFDPLFLPNAEMERRGERMKWADSYQGRFVSNRRMLSGIQLLKPKQREWTERFEEEDEETNVDVIEREEAIDLTGAPQFPVDKYEVGLSKDTLLPVRSLPKEIPKTFSSGEKMAQRVIACTCKMCEKVGDAIIALVHRDRNT